MEYNKIYAAALKVYQECNIHSFPFHCKTLIKHYRYQLYTYKELKKKSPELYEICIRYSEDAFHDQMNHLIIYNESIQQNRVRFSLMHELGHIILEHHGCSDTQEKEANMFAGLLLAPGMAIHYSRLRSAEEISSVFNISYEAAVYSLKSYYRWYSHTLVHRMSALDKQMYQHFYNKKQKCFVWNIRQCTSCGKTIYNSQLSRCPGCLNLAVQQRPEREHTFYFPSSSDFFTRQEQAVSRRAENQWLYGKHY